MIRRPPRSTRKESSAASDVYKRQSSAFAIDEQHERVSGRVLTLFDLVEPEGTERGCSWPFVPFLGKKACLGPSRILSLASQITTRLCCTAHKKKCHFADFLHKCTTGSTSSCVFFLYNSMTFRRSATTSSTLVIPKCTTRRCTLRCSKIQCGKATALFVRSKHRDIVAQV